MARKTRIETGDLGSQNKLETTEIAHKVVKDHFQRYINAVNIVLTGVAIMVGVIGVVGYFWLQLMVKSEVDKIRTELAIPKSAIVGMATLARDKAGVPTCPQGWSYLSVAEGRFVIGAMPLYAMGQQPEETLILRNTEEILRFSNANQPTSGDAQYARDDSANLAASIGKTSISKLWEEEKQKPETDASNDQSDSAPKNLVPYTAAYFCLKE